MSGIYDAAMDNVTCLLPIDRPKNEVWTRYVDVFCKECDASERFYVVCRAPKQALADKQLHELMREDGWYSTDESGVVEDYCPRCAP